MAVEVAELPPSQAECLGSWQHPPEQEGWHIAHAALRTDMRLLMDALAALQRSLAIQKPLLPWQVSAVKNFWSQFNENVLRHHIQEEANGTVHTSPITLFAQSSTAVFYAVYYFPWLATRIMLPSKVSADHETIAALQAKLTAAIRPLDAGQEPAATASVLSDFAVSFEEYRSLLMEHLEEEERDVVSQMRCRFTQVEERQVLSEAIDHCVEHELPAMLWHLPPSERRSFMTKAGVPKMRQWLAVGKQVKQYDREFMRGIAAVIADREPLVDLDL